MTDVVAYAYQAAIWCLICGQATGLPEGDDTERTLVPCFSSDVNPIDDADDGSGLVVRWDHCDQCRDCIDHDRTDCLSDHELVILAEIIQHQKGEHR